MSGAPVEDRRTATIEADMPCMRCGYNLRSLQSDAICPECATPVQHTIRYRWLPFADPVWLKRLRRGATSVLWLILALVAGCTILVTLAPWLTPGGRAPSAFPTTCFGFLLVLLGVFGWLICVWDLTAPEPTEADDSSSDRLCRWARGLTASGIVGSAAFTFFNLIATAAAAGGMAESSVVIVISLAIACWIAHGVGFLLLLIHIRRMARRDIGRGLAKLMTVLIWGGLVVSGGALVTSIFAVFFWLSLAAGPGFAAASPGTTAPTTAPGTIAATVTVSPSGSLMTASMPVGTTVITTTAPVAPFPAFGGSLILFIGLASMAANVIGLAWFVAWIVAMFWFRKILGRALSGGPGPQVGIPVPSSGTNAQD